VIADFRFPRGVKPLIWLGAGVAAIWYITIPRLGHRRPSLSGLAFEIWITFAMLALSVVALLCAGVYLFRRVPFWSRLYSRLTLWIVGGNASLLVIGYFQTATKEPELGHYSLAPMVLVASGAALIPALVAEMAAPLRRRSM
jgi:multisubunit Na+/H+ antiporter MnhC subunit